MGVDVYAARPCWNKSVIDDRYQSTQIDRATR